MLTHCALSEIPLSSVSVIEPGGVDTDIMANMVAQGLGGHEEVLKNPEVDDIDKTLSSCFDHKDIYHVSLRDDSHSQTPDDIADLILRVATDDKPHFRYQTSQVMSHNAKTGVLNLIPVGVNRGPRPQVLTLHPRVST